MDDKTKLALISKMIDDFWEYETDAQQEKGAITIVTAIAAVVDFREDGHE